MEGAVADETTHGSLRPQGQLASQRDRNTGAQRPGPAPDMKKILLRLPFADGRKHPFDQQWKRRDDLVDDR